MRRSSAPARALRLSRVLAVRLCAAAGSGAAARRAPAAATAPPGRREAPGTTGARDDRQRRHHRRRGRHRQRRLDRRHHRHRGLDRPTAAARPAPPAAAPRARRHDRHAGRGGTHRHRRHDGQRAGTTGGGGRLGQLHVHAVVGDQHRRSRPSASSPGRRRSPARRRRKIDFGLTTSYGMTAPVDHAQREQPDVAARHEDVSSMYHYRITATSGTRLLPERRLHDHDRPARRTGCMKPTVTTSDRDRRSPAASSSPASTPGTPASARRRTSSTPTATTSGRTAASRRQ